MCRFKANAIYLLFIPGTPGAIETEHIFLRICHQYYTKNDRRQSEITHYSKKN